MSKLHPRLYVNAVRDIDINRLKEAGITAFLCDIDNTLAVTESAVASDEISAWVRAAREAGFGVCLVSNNNEKRVSKFAESLDVPYVSRAMKPLLGGYRKAAKILGIKLENACMIGDQIFTDIWGANRIGAYSILVNKISEKESILSSCKRPIEKLIMKGYKR